VSISTRNGGPSAVLYRKNMPVGTASLSFVIWRESWRQSDQVCCKRTRDPDPS
jgi:hypothetical protein